MRFPLNLNNMWVKIIARLRSTRATKEEKIELTLKSFQSPTNWRRVPWLSVSKKEYK